MDWIVFITLFSAYVGLLFTIFNLLVYLYLKEEKAELREYKEWPKVSIIVPAYNEEKNIENTIRSLLNLDYDKDKLEIIVVDDGSKDRTYEIAKKYENNIVKVFRKENGGKASALNYGLKYATGEFIATMDADSVVPPDALKKMLRYFTSDDIMIVVPSIQVISTKTIVEKVQFIEYSYANYLRMIFDKINSIYVAPGPFSIFRRELFEKIGYFDEKNLTEDMEIAMRAHQYGYRIRHCPDVVVRTEAPQSFSKLIKQRARWYLGYIENFSKYRKLIKDKIIVELVFGSSILFIIIPILTLFILLYTTFDNIKTTYNFYASINFNIWPFLNKYLSSFYKIDWERLGLEYNVYGMFLLIISIVSFSIFLYFMLNVWRYEQGKKSIRALSLFLYAMLYLLFYSIMWIVVLYYKTFARELKWGGIVWNNSLINKIWK